MKRAAAKKAKKRPVPAQTVDLRVALAQINTVVGDFKENTAKLKSCLNQARRHRADVVLFPELAVTGYPPEDLLHKPAFVRKNLEVLKQRVVPSTRGITAVVGYVEPAGNALYNSAALISDGKWIGSYRKMLLPNYGVFDEKRYFREGAHPVRFILKGVRLALTICEDVWEPDGPGKRLSDEGLADVILNISCSPYHKGKDRETMIRDRARRYKAHLVYCNVVGGQDELVFDGQSLVVAPDGSLLAHGNAFMEEMVFADLEIVPKPAAKKIPKAAAAAIKTYRVRACGSPAASKKPIPPREFRRLEEVEEVYQALTLGTRDYITKNGFEKAVIGLSGGIDSALTATIACDAVGPDNVVGVMMPSPFSSQGSLDDARELVANLKIEKTVTLPIEEAMRAYDKILAEEFRGTERGVAEENLQARIRGNLLMALSNKMGWLVLTTGNKSEGSVGYCTLYGDMAGGFAVIKDVPKTWVYELSAWVNEREGKPVIPENILRKAPSAELRPDQKDTDAIPDYSLLDPVLARYIEEDQGIEELKGLGLSRKEIQRVLRLVDANEYKRRQAPPGIKITPKAFGRDRRLPITNRFKG